MACRWCLAGRSAAHDRRGRWPAVRDRFARSPRVALVLGTGLGGLAEAIDVEVAIEYGDIPWFPLSTVESHGSWPPPRAARCVCRTIIAMQGRFHR